MKCILLLLALTAATTTLTAHPGKTDANGWHTDSKTGQRHQHPKPDAKKDQAKKPAVKKPDTPAKKDEPKKKK